MATKNKTQPIPKVGKKIKIRIQIDEVMSCAVTGSILELIPDGRVKVEYEHPFRRIKINEETNTYKHFKSITIVDFNK